MIQVRGDDETVKEVAIAIIIAVSVAAASAAVSFYRYATSGDKAHKKTAVIWIKPGQSFSETVTRLQELGLVRHPGRFRLLARLRGDDKRIQAGEYLLHASMSPAGILDSLVRGESILHKVVIPEGSTISRIGQILEKAGLMSKEAFLKAASDPELMQALGVEGDTFEGFLFPDTYYFPKGVTPEQVIRKMVASFRSVFTAAWTERARAMGLTIHQVVTLASIVEKETAKAEERPLIAAVFLNRLRHHMRLESDPTVIYGIRDFDGNLTRKDLDTVTPYNTYRIGGLPPGPISNPGRASIEAILYPSEKPYLYFVSKNDGSHHFSRTLSEHNKMVRRYQQRR